MQHINCVKTLIPKTGKNFVPFSVLGKIRLLSDIEFLNRQQLKPFIRTISYQVEAIL